MIINWKENFTFTQRNGGSFTVGPKKGQSPSDYFYLFDLKQLNGVGTYQRLGRDVKLKWTECHIRAEKQVEEHDRRAICHLTVEFTLFKTSDGGQDRLAGKAVYHLFLNRDKTMRLAISRQDSDVEIFANLKGVNEAIEQFLNESQAKEALQFFYNNNLSAESLEAISRPSGKYCHGKGTPKGKRIPRLGMDFRDYEEKRNALADQALTEAVIKLMRGNEGERKVSLDKTRHGGNQRSGVVPAAKPILHTAPGSFIDRLKQQIAYSKAQNQAKGATNREGIKPIVVAG
jgi:hypothetical protein